MTSLFKQKASLVALGTVLALSACGGGGGTSTPAASGSGGNSTTLAASAITSTNAKDVGAQAFFAADSLNTQVSSGAGSAALATGVSVSTTQTGLLDTALAQTRFALQNLGNNLVVGVAVSRTVNCPQGGTEVITGNVASATTISSGDSLTFTANNCLAGTTAINGSMNISFANVSGNLAPGGTGTATLKLTFNNFSVSDGGINDTATGDLTIALNQAGTTESFNANGTSLQMRTVKGTSVVDRTLSGFQYTGSTNSSNVYIYTTNFTLNGSFPKLGTSTYTVKTTKPFQQQLGGYPTQGAVTVTATDKSSLTLTAVNSTNVTLTIDRNGDGTTDETVNTTWTELAGLL